jgi:neuralized-like protein 4
MSASSPSNSAANDLASPNKHYNKKDTYSLPSLITFGFDKEHHSSQMKISEDGKMAIKRDPELVYANGVVYSDRPIKGHCEFEIEIVAYGTSWSGNIKLGLVSHKSGEQRNASNIPRYTPESIDHCVWCASKLHDHIISMTEFPYGQKTLDDLRVGDRLGIQLTKNGSLQYFLNGVPQGIGATNLYRPGYDLYMVVDHYANCRITKITRAGNVMYNVH